MATNGSVYGYPAAVSGCFRYTLICMFLGAVGGIIFGFIQAFLRNDPPIYDFVLESLSVSNLNISGNQISGDWDIGLNLTNPSRRTTKVFEDVKYSVVWSGAPDQAIITGSEAPVVQPPKSRTTLHMKGSAEWLTLPNMMTGDFILGRVEDFMRREIVNNGSLTFDITLSGKLRFKRRFTVDHYSDPLGETFHDIRVPLLASNSTPNTLIGAYHNIPGQYIG